jgi:poly(3-hydroxyalkanoate) synthetase
MSATDRRVIVAVATLEPVTLADPMSPLRWTSESIWKLTAERRAGKYLVSDSAVRRLLAEQGYSLQVNVKPSESGQLVARVEDETTQNYLQNRTEKGKSKRDVIRCLKRYLAREIFTILKTFPDQHKNTAQHSTN